MISKYYEKLVKYIKENKYFLLTLIIIFVVFTFPMPYVIEAPGGVITIDERIDIDDGYESDGSFGMAYVSMIKGTLPSMFFSLFNKNWEISKASDMTYDDETLEEMDKREKYDMEEAISNATIVAYTYAEKEVNIKSKNLRVTYFDENADTDLKLYDIILRVNGHDVSTTKDIRDVIGALDENTNEVAIEVLRNNKLITCTAKLFNTEDGKKIGILTNTSYELETNPEINISSKDNESGPSGGLITALSIYNHLVKEDITKGKKIIGTGTIDAEGNVGEIGGVKYKLLGAEKDKCEVFIVPKENYEEAIKVKEEYKLKINIISVSTFEEAVNSLKNL